MWPWGHPQNYPRLPESQVYLYILCFISLDMAPWQGLGRTWTPVLQKNLLVLHSSPALVDKCLTGVMVAGLPLTLRGLRAPRHPASKSCPLHGASSVDRKNQVTWCPHGPQSLGLFSLKKKTKDLIASQGPQIFSFSHLFELTP